MEVSNSVKSNANVTPRIPDLEDLTEFLSAPTLLRSFYDLGAGQRLSIGLVFSIKGKGVAAAGLYG